MKKSTFTLFIIFSMSVSLMSCYSEQEATPALQNYSVEEELMIGEDPDALPLLSSVSDAVTNNTANRIFLVDGLQRQIHAFNPDGSHLWSNGGQGPGPGEFEMISNIFTDDQGRLYVYDFRKGTITFYNSDGQMEGIVPSNIKGSYIEHIRSISGQRFIVPTWDGENIIHIYSDEFEEILASLVSLDEVRQTTDEREDRIIRNNPGSAILLDDGLIAYAPYHYADTITLYEETSPNQWEQTQTVEGYRSIDPTFTIRASQSSVFDERSHLLYATPDGTTLIEFHSISFGLYPQSDGTFVHLSYLSTDEGMELVVERFNTEELQLESYSIIDELGIGQQYRKEPVWMDPEGIIYMRDSNDGIPRLRKINLVKE